MKYRYKRHITNTLLYAIIKEYTRLGAIIFAIVSILALGADRIIENNHLKEEESRGIPPKP
jgi:hypothetical protein